MKGSCAVVCDVLQSIHLDTKLIGCSSRPYRIALSIFSTRESVQSLAKEFFPRFREWIVKMFRSTQLKVDHLCRLFSEPGGKNVDGLCTLCCKISGFETSYESLSRVSKIEVLTFIEFPRDIFNCTCGVTFIFNLYKTQTSRGYRIISLCVQCVIALLP